MKKYSNYKPSKLNWIGKIPQDWQINKIKIFCLKITRWIGLILIQLNKMVSLYYGNRY